MNFVLPVRVYYQDTDAGGVVFHSSYIDFMERARSEWLRSLGFSNCGLVRDHQVFFMVRALEITYFKPAVLDDLLEVGVEIESMGRSQMVFRQDIMRDALMLASAKISLVCATTDTLKPVRVPGAIRSKLEI
ncbi:MAG: tol-pal system-associated acyl-CoA thioesterase [Burkholderiales bacterium]|nr:tol-pal system-associated acyl-CoA thioesterase [Burkholderiales bacterium]